MRHAHCTIKLKFSKSAVIGPLTETNLGGPTAIYLYAPLCNFMCAPLKQIKVGLSKLTYYILISYMFAF